MAGIAFGILTVAGRNGVSGAGALRAGVTTSHYSVYLSSNTWIPAIIVAESGKFLIAPLRCLDVSCPLESEFDQLLGIPLPVLGHLNMQIQIDSGAQKGLDALPCVGTDLPQPASALAYDDGLL